MVMYAIGTLPLIRKIKKLAPDVYHLWYTDDSSAIGRFADLKDVFVGPRTWGMNYGHLPYPS